MQRVINFNYIFIIFSNNYFSQYNGDVVVTFIIWHKNKPNEPAERRIIYLAQRHIHNSFVNPIS